MAKTAIDVQGLSKSYYIGKQDKRGALGQFVGMFTDPFRRAVMLMRGGAPTFADESVEVLKGISFRVQEGEVLGVIGANGAGKSTLLKILSGITYPTKGTAKLYGRVGALLEVGTGFHQELTGRENVYLNGSILGMTRAEISQRFDDIVAFAGVEKFIDTPVKRYSSGMKVRLAFAVAAYLNPEILLVDEVLAVGDASFQQRSLNKMSEVTRDARTVLFVSHQMDMVRAICTRCLFLEGGRIAYEGTPDAAIDAYLKHLSQRGSITRFEAPDDPELSLQVLNGRVLNAEGQEAGLLDVFETAYLELEYVVRKPLEGHILSLEVQRNGATLFMSFDTDEHPEGLGKREAGVYRARLRLPTPHLKAGFYALTLRTGRPNVAIQQELRDALRFEVQLLSKPASLLSYSDNRPGVVAMPLAWETTALTTKVNA
jgi:lipopolysaccharide transport system ATP-binding protein